MLRKRARAAVLWSGVDILARQGIGFIITVLMARLLLPEDFGTIALLSIFLGISQLFVNAGFSQALIQKQDATHLDESTIFWFNTCIGAAVTVVLFLLAPWVASFFELEVLIPLTQVMSCIVFIGALGSIQGTLLTKKLDFKTPMKIGVLSVSVSGFVGVYLALANYGVWALAAQQLIGATINTVALWVIGSWRPLFAFSGNSLTQLLKFGGWIFASGALETLYQRAYTLLIGKFYGAAELGIYNRADATQQLPASILSGVLSRVTFPLFSEGRKDENFLREGVRLSVRSMMLIMIPSMTGLAILAEPFIRVVFGEQWLPAVPILQVLCAAGAFYPLHVINLSVLQAQGHANLFFRLEVAKKCIGVALLIVGSFYGLMGIALSRVIHSYFAFAINGHYTGKFLDYGCRQQIKDFIPSLILSALMGLLLVALDCWLVIGGVRELLILILFGFCFYVAMNVLLGVAAFREAVGFILGGSESGRPDPKLQKK